MHDSLRTGSRVLRIIQLKLLLKKNVPCRLNIFSLTYIMASAHWQRFAQESVHMPIQNMKMHSAVDMVEDVEGFMACIIMEDMEEAETVLLHTQTLLRI